MKTPRRISFRALIPVAIAVVAVLAAVGANPHPSQGLRLGYENGEVVVASVEYGSIAYLDGINPGQVVAQLDDTYVLPLSDSDKAALALSQGPWSGIQTISREHAATEEARFPVLVAAAASGQIPWLLDPTSVVQCDPNGGVCSFTVSPTDQSTAVPFDIAYFGRTPQLCALTEGTQLASPQGLEVPSDGSLCVTTGTPATYSYSSSWRNIIGLPPFETPSFGPFALGLAILGLGWLAIRRGWAGAGLRPYALTLPVATAVPLFVAAIDRYPSEWAVVVGSLLVPLAMLPLAIDFIGRLEGRRRRRIVGLTVVGR